MLFTAVLDTDLSGPQLIQAVQDAFGAALVFQESTETSEAVTHRWQGAEADESLKIVEDTATNAVYAITPSSAYRAEVVASFGSFSAADVRDVIESDLAAEHVRLPMLAFCNSGSFDTETERLIVLAARHPDAAVRLSAVHVMGMLRWPGLNVQLAAMCFEQDPRLVSALQRIAAVSAARAAAANGAGPKKAVMKKDYRKRTLAKKQNDGSHGSSGGARNKGAGRKRP